MDIPELIEGVPQYLWIGKALILGIGIDLYYFYKWKRNAKNEENKRKELKKYFEELDEKFLDAQNYLCEEKDANWISNCNKLKNIRKKISEISKNTTEKRKVGSWREKAFFFRK